jgi:hypothetical protein
VFRFADPTPDNLEDQGPTPIFGIEAFRRDSDEGIDQGYAIYLLDSETPIETGSSIPGSFDFEIDLSDPAFAALFTSPFPPFPAPFSLDDPNLFEFTLVARASCDDDPCSATSRLDETLYIELEGKSANGCSYLGRDAVDPPPTGIVEPASGLMLLGGLAALAATLRGRRRHG